MKKLFVVLLLCSIGVNLAVAQTTFGIKLQAVRTSDTAPQRVNIFNFTVDYADSTAIDKTKKYSVRYFLDNRFDGEFKNQVIPFSFTRNFRGQAAGSHEVKIEVEDSGKNVLASGVVSVKVQ